jgi:hypothetical protein
MKLEIDLMNADEVKAGMSLLARVSEAQAETKAAVRTIPPGVVVPRSVTEFIQRTQVPDGEEFYTAEGMNPAAVFGGTPVADPLPSSTTVPLPPVAIVPTTPIPGHVSSVAAVELDVKGLPWDSRIHSSSKNKLANGCWKVARGKAPEYVAQVESELRCTPTSGGLAVPIPPAPIVVDGVDISKPLIGRDGRIIVPVPLTPPPPPAPNADPSSFETLMTRISPQISAGVLPPQAVMEACKANGLQSVVGLQSSPQLVPLVWATLKATYPALV